VSAKVDLKKLDGYRARRGEFSILDLPPRGYLMIDGHGDPNTADFSTAIETLFPVAYALKFASKRELDRDYVVPPLEGLWSSPDPTVFTSARDKSRWDWTLLSLVPDWIGAEHVAAAIQIVARRNPPTRLDELRLETLDEGRCVQTLHVGSFDDEGEVLARMHDEFIPSNGLVMTGRHHELYLSDFRRVEPSRLRTILRQPVAPAR
jgi:hypothetical protein